MLDICTIDLQAFRRTARLMGIVAVAAINDVLLLA